MELTKVKEKIMGTWSFVLIGVAAVAIIVALVLKKNK